MFKKPSYFKLALKMKHIPKIKEKLPTLENKYCTHKIIFGLDLKPLFFPSL